MTVRYMNKAFVPKVSGCGAQDGGWDDKRCKQFEDFLNTHAVAGWRLHSSEYRNVTVKGCGSGRGAWLVCTFEKMDVITNASQSDMHGVIESQSQPKFCNSCGEEAEAGVAFCSNCGKQLAV